MGFNNSVQFSNKNNKKIKGANVTLYYKNDNYGANLQAYALCVATNKCGYTTEQLCFPITTTRLTEANLKEKKRTLKDYKIAIKVFIYNCLIFNRRLYAKRMVRKRKKTVLAFNENVIPHSKQIYNVKNICEVKKEYDFFVTGSDQVWNPNWYSPILTLELIPKEIPKFSYAPSIGVAELTKSEREIYQRFLQTYQAVSVREKNAVSLLNELSPFPVEWVLDPTLLLDYKDWNQICSKRVIQEPYIFCYFLGSNQKSRMVAQQYAKKRGLKIVTIPYLLGYYRECDFYFGDIQLSDSSPKEFISLIRFAENVFTDSFHACVFSFIYQKQFFAFRREAWDNMGSRILSFLELLDCVSRYCDTDKKETMEYIESQLAIDYSTLFPTFERMKKTSWEYLERNLKLAEERVQQNEKH